MPSVWALRLTDVRFTTEDFHSSMRLLGHLLDHHPITPNTAHHPPIEWELGAHLLIRRIQAS